MVIRGWVVSDESDGGEDEGYLPFSGGWCHDRALFQVVAFYNTRDVTGWPEPEVAANVNNEELGDLGLTSRELEDLVAFLETLSDGWEPGGRASDGQRLLHR
jgi:hypothetical protein